MLTVFDLKPGVVYNATTGGKKVNRQFKIIGGQLKNNYGGGEFVIGCEYVPMDATFEEAEAGTHEKAEPQESAILEGGAIGLFQMKENNVYRTSGTEKWAKYYVRIGNKLFSYNNNLNEVQEEEKFPDLGTSYMLVKELENPAKMETSNAH